MEPTERDAAALIAAVTPAARRRDAETLVALMRDITGDDPVVWSGGIIGFGSYHYRYTSGREGDAPAAGFAPRKPATVVYLSDGIDAHQDALEGLGPHTAGVGCLYLKDLETVDMAVLRGILTRSFQTLTDGTYGLRARDRAKPV